MALSEIFFLAIVFYLLYRFVFNFLVPVARTTKHVRRQFRNMQEMQEAMREQGGMRQQETQGQPRPVQPQRPAQKPPTGDYIDFEEIKD
ncbi:MAG TPA: hypothetical protein VNW04_12150 [Puia sp.]|jgi:hypothetical protein|nr:hypothetical protein [Puia sp.]